MSKIDKIMSFVTQGPVMAVILVVGTFLIIHPKDRSYFLLFAILGIILALGSRFIDFLFDFFEK